MKKQIFITHGSAAFINPDGCNSSSKQTFNTKFHVRAFSYLKSYLVFNSNSFTISPFLLFVFFAITNGVLVLVPLIIVPVMFLMEVSSLSDDILNTTCFGSDVLGT